MIICATDIDVPDGVKPTAGEVTTIIYIAVGVSGGVLLAAGGGIVVVVVVVVVFTVIKRTAQYDKRYIYVSEWTSELTMYRMT